MNETNPQVDSAHLRDARQAESRPLAGKVVVRSGTEAINATERLICGRGAARSPSAAEGFALAGRRAANLLTQDNAATAPLNPTVRMPMVYHRVRALEDISGSFLAFELHATHAQEAVLHCLVAHDLSARLGVPGICTVGTRITDGFHPVRLPTPEAVAALPPQAQAVKNGFRYPKSDIIETAQQAFDRFNAIMGTAYQAIHLHAMDDAEFVLVATGGAATDARHAVERLRAAGLPFGLLTVAMVNPLPQAHIASLLANKRGVAVVEHGSMPPELSRILAGIREALADNGQAAATVPLLDSDNPELPALAAAVFGLNFATTQVTEPEAATTRTLTIAAAPSGPMSDAFLLDIASYLCRLANFSVHRGPSPHPLLSSFTLTNGTTQPTGLTPPDVLFLAHPGLLDVVDILDHVAPGGTVLIQGSTHRVESFWMVMSDHLRQVANAKKLTLKWFDIDAVNEYQAVPTGGALAVHGAMLAASPRFAALLPSHLASHGIIDAAGLHLEAWEQVRLRSGANAVQEVNRDIAERTEWDPYFRPQRRLPRMPRETGTTSEEWRVAIRNFFLTGQGSYSSAHPLPALSLRPAALNPHLEAQEAVHDYPLILNDIAPDRDVASPFSLAFDAALDAIQAAGTDVAELRALRLRLFDDLRDRTKGAIQAQSLGECLTQSLQHLAPNNQALQATIPALIERLPKQAPLLGLGEHTLVTLYVHAVKKARQQRIAKVLQDTRTLITRLRELLQTDDAYGPRGRTAGAISSSIGQVGLAFLDPVELAEHLVGQPGAHKGHSAERLHRINATIHTLEAFVNTPQEDLVLVHSGLIPPTLCFDGVRLIEHQDGLKAALGLFDGIAERMVGVFKAMRVARLEVAGTYDEELHHSILASFSWQDIAAEELLLFPVVCVLESTDRLFQGMLAQLSELLRSGRPVDVLALERTSAAILDDSNSCQVRYNPGFGYLAVAHREAFVTQTTLGRPAHLMRGLEKMNVVLRPAVAVVAVPTWTWRLPMRVQLEAAQLGRTAPCFEYDPSQGESWTERFNIDENPQPEQIWPLAEVQFIDPDGQTATMQTEFTFAHALALEPGYRQYFRIVPVEAWNEEMIEVGRFLREAPGESARLPFIWGVVDGELRRAVMTRDVALACRDRMRLWRSLQELAGKDRATAAAPQTLPPTPPPPPPSISPEQLAAAAATATTDTIQKILAFVTNLLPSTPAQGAPTLTSTPPSPATLAERSPTTTEDSSATAPTPAPAASAATQQAPSPATPPGPWIDSEQCISCNECISINDEVFVYNDNGQATIGDLRRGTHAQWLAAAEACPAECIHPGPEPAREEPHPAPSAATDAPQAPRRPATIDSAQCISCNECISINDQMFAYNDDVQAHIADRSAGTFAELVAAAEACPAECIHPGDPLPHEAVSPELIARARKL